MPRPVQLERHFVSWTAALRGSDASDASLNAILLPEHHSGTLPYHLMLVTGRVHQKNAITKKKTQFLEKVKT